MKKTTTLVLTLLLGAKLFAQQQIAIDLTQGKPDDKKVATGTVQLNLTNALPADQGWTYTVTTSVVNVLPGPIILPVNSVSTNKFGDDSQCAGSQAISDAVSNVFKNVISEDQVKANFAAVTPQVLGLTGDCLTEGKAALAKQDAKRNLILYVPDLKANQIVTVTITRANKDGANRRFWEFKLTTEKIVDSWLIHYGFTYQPNVFSTFPQYFAKADPTTANTYTITRQNGNPENALLNSSPSLAFTHPFSRNYSGFMPGVSIVTGTNLSTYSAGLGLSGIIAYNGLISVGMMYTQKSALNGQYKEGDVIKDNLNFDQLHYKRGCFELFLTLAIRLDKNPFSSGSSTAKSSSGAAAATGTAAAGGTAATTGTSGTATTGNH
jgi:hypothetical protein